MHTPACPQLLTVNKGERMERVVADNTENL